MRDFACAAEHVWEGVGNLPEKDAVDILLTFCRTSRLAKAILGVDTDALDAAAHTTFSSAPAEKLPASTKACFTHVGQLLNRTQLSSADISKVLETDQAAKGKKQSILGILSGSRFGKLVMKDVGCAVENSAGTELTLVRKDEGHGVGAEAHGGPRALG